MSRTSHCTPASTGTDVIAPLIEQAAERLKPGGALFIEISPMIAAEVEQLIRDTPRSIAATLRDLRQRMRDPVPAIHESPVRRCPPHRTMQLDHKPPR